MTRPGREPGLAVHRPSRPRPTTPKALRLFYVAATRARDALILSAATDPATRPTSPALTLLDARFDRASGLFRGELPAGWHPPRVEVLAAEPTPPSPGLAPPAPIPRPRIHLLEAAMAIDEGAARVAPQGPPRRRLPRFVDLDPAAGLPSTLARLDRLTRTILAEPDALDPAALGRIADRAARLQDPVASVDLRRRAVERLAEVLPVIREAAGPAVILRGVEWTEVVDLDGDRVVFRGRADLAFRDASGHRSVVIVSDSAAIGPAERLRLLLSGRAGAATRGIWIRSGPGGGVRRFDRPDDDAAIARAIREWFGRRPG